MLLLCVTILEKLKTTTSYYCLVRSLGKVLKRFSLYYSNIHHTVSGHEAMELAKRLTEELQNSSHAVLLQGSTDPTRQKVHSPEPRARSLDQQKPHHATAGIPIISYSNKSL